MTDWLVPEQERLPLALAVATGHEARVVQRALLASNAPDPVQSRFEVVQVGAGCSELDSNLMVEAYSAIVSTGFAGALEPDIESGSILSPDIVRKVDNSVYDVDANLQQTISTRLHADVVGGPLLHTDLLLATTEQKQQAREKSKCIACDMESASLCATAKQGGRPFACLRIVLDPANTTIPKPIVELADSHSDPSASAFIRALLRHPGDTSATTAFLWHTFKASRALSRAVTQIIQGSCK